MKRSSALLIAGFSCFLAMNSFSLWDTRYLAQLAFGNEYSVFWIIPLTLSNIATFFAFALLTRKRNKSTPPLRLAIFVLLVGLLFLIGYLSTEQLALLVLAAAFTGIGTTFCFFCWELLFFEIGQHQERCVLLGGCILSCIPHFIFLLIGQNNHDYLLFFLGILILLNLICLRAAFKLVFDKNKDNHANKEKPAFSNHKNTFQVWYSVICIAIIGLSSSLLGTVTTDSSLRLSETSLGTIVSSLISAAIMTALWLILKEKTSIRRVYFILFPILITCLLIFPVLQDNSKQIIICLLNSLFMIFSMVMMDQCITLSQENQNRLIVIYGILGGVTYLSRLAGEVVGDTLLQLLSYTNESIIVAATMILMYGGSIALYLTIRSKPAQNTIAEQNSIKQDIESPSQTTTQQELHEPEEDSLDRACALLTEKYQLSQRQSEVLSLLAHGYDVPAIAKKLWLSENTIRTHVKRIYALLEVHSKAELLDVVNSMK